MCSSRGVGKAAVGVYVYHVGPLVAFVSRFVQAFFGRDARSRGFHRGHGNSLAESAQAVSWASDLFTSSCAVALDLLVFIRKRSMVLLVEALLLRGVMQ